MVSPVVPQQMESHGQLQILGISRIMFLAGNESYGDGVPRQAEQVGDENMLHDLHGQHGVALAAQLGFL